MPVTMPENPSVGNTGPELCCEIGLADDDAPLMEFYPYPTDHDTVLYSYYKRTPDWKPGMRIPAEIDLEALKQGVLIDVYRFEMAQALRENRVDAAAVWGNHLRSQETVWENRVQEILRAERTTYEDDLEMLLHTRGPHVQNELTFIRSARQDALSRLSNFP